MTQDEYKAFIVDCVNRDDAKKLHGLFEQLFRYGFTPVDVFCFIADLARECVDDEKQRWIFVILYGCCKKEEPRFRFLRTPRPKSEYLNEMYDQYLFDEKFLA